jgi:hypothetical protein
LNSAPHLAQKAYFVGDIERGGNSLCRVLSTQRTLRDVISNATQSSRKTLKIMLCHGKAARGLLKSCFQPFRDRIAEQRQLQVSHVTFASPSELEINWACTTNGIEMRNCYKILQENLQVMDSLQHLEV